MSRRHIVGLVCALMLPMLLAAKPASSRQAKDPAQMVELFSAIKAGDLQVKFIPKDATQATLIVENKTKKPLRIALPSAFAGVPALAQDDGGGGFEDFGAGGLGGDQGGQGQQGQQALGGGMGGGMMGGGMGGGMMGGMMSVPPERTKKVKLATVCLEHGKKDPNPRVAYNIVPLDAFSSDPHVRAVCEVLGNGKIDQASAQAAAWHFTDGLTLQQLANKVKTKHLNGTRTMYFNALNLQRASKLVHVARAHAKKQTQKSPGEKSEGLEEAEL